MAMVVMGGQGEWAEATVVTGERGEWEEREF